ncbi:MAG: CoA-binding protein [Sulfobacillus acidophilus]|uniref:CoA-binding protein n=1 Tax=Sulfobacillus acidophilus TaxID=53633 RepID=A0A2T2WFC3_9FIRM|nr:MAG: CoA-binding protein [Sulfobacillus acidophilus]
MRIILRDGRVAELRPPVSTAQDRDLLRQLFRRASTDSLYFRFFHVVAEISDQELDRMTQMTPGQSYALVCDAGEALWAIGNYVRTGADTAEVAFFVDDRMQGRGLGTLLLEHLAEHAWRDGFRHFVAYVLSENHQMLRVFRSSGFAVSQHWADGAIELTLPLGQTERQKSLMALREKLATAASLQPFFHPRTVAVVGASRDDERLGHRLLWHIVEGNFSGTVYPVNREAGSVHAIKAYARLSDIPEPVDLAFVVVPSRELLPIVNDAIYAGVKGLVITSSGLGDAGAQGQALEETIVAKLRRAGIRLVGPSSMGLVSTEPSVTLNASFAPQLPARGQLAVASHSSALGVAIMHYASRMGLGISSFVSLGNKPDVSVNDLLQYWEDDPETTAIMLYMESFGNPRKFSQIARRLTRHKPILAVKSARTRPLSEGSNPGRFQWDMSDAPVDALFRQSGIIRADTLEELFDVAAIITSQPLVRGGRVGLVTNSAAGTLLAEDSIHTLGLTLVEAIDVGFDSLAQGYNEAIPRMLARTDIDALAVLFVPVGDRETREVLEAVRRCAAQYFSQAQDPIPIVANILLANPTSDRFIDAGSRRIPVFAFPETALRALARVRDYGQFMMRPPGRIVDLAGVKVGEARLRVREALQSDDLVSLPAAVIERVWEAMGITIQKVPNQLSGNLAVAMASDALFGPILGVRRADGETRIRLIPVTDEDVLRLVPDAIRQTGDEDLWIDLLLRLSRLIEECPEIQSFEIVSIEVRNHCLRAGDYAMTVRPA